MDEQKAIIGETEIREQYEARMWQALELAAQLGAHGAKLAEESAVQSLTSLIDELALKGWAARLVFGPQNTGTRALHFYPLPKDAKEALDKHGLPLAAMTDRELLVKLDDMIYAYDRRRDDELDYLNKHPNRDAWDDDERKAYEEICSDIRDQYAELWRVLDHIDRTRRPAPQTPPEKSAAT